MTSWKSGEVNPPPSEGHEVADYNHVVRRGFIESRMWYWDEIKESQERCSQRAPRKAPALTILLPKLMWILRKASWQYCSIWRRNGIELWVVEEACNHTSQTCSTWGGHQWRTQQAWSARSRWRWGRCSWDRTSRRPAGQARGWKMRWLFDQNNTKRQYFLGPYNEMVL